MTAVMNSTDIDIEDCPWCNAHGANILGLFADAPKMAALHFPLLKISRARGSSSNPDGLWISDGQPYGMSTFYGSIRDDGTIRYNKAATTDIRNQVARLEAFTTREIAEVGKASGRCVYCGLTLTDPVSVELGYGPICAKHHGLPHR